MDIKNYIVLCIALRSCSFSDGGSIRCLEINLDASSTQNDVLRICLVDLSKGKCNTIDTCLWIINCFMNKFHSCNVDIRL